MKIIKIINECIEDEMEGAEHYAKMALEYKEDYPSLARVCHEASLQELQHMDNLHGEVVKLINEYRRTEGEPPEAMMAIYNWEHEKQIDRVARIKAMQSMYK